MSALACGKKKTYSIVMHTMGERILSFVYSWLSTTRFSFNFALEKRRKCFKSECLCSFQFCKHVGSIWECPCLSREIESSKHEAIVKTNQVSCFFTCTSSGVNKRFLTSLLCLCYPIWPPLPWYLSGLVASHKYEEWSLLESVIYLLAEITC